ncbi:MAG: hypothetical protein LBB98_14315 [Treponema sp.]|nr:hypothetical protein [Treponema sp.]
MKDFRGNRLTGVREAIFVTAVKLLQAKGYSTVDHSFVDGTKMESARGRYLFVRKQSIEQNERKREEKLRA